MKFSVVISTYNRLNLLKRAINSALNQTIPCEVVVADDCSADETEAYVKSLGNSVIYHRNEVNKRPCSYSECGSYQSQWRLD